MQRDPDSPTPQHVLTADEATRAGLPDLISVQGLARAWVLKESTIRKWEHTGAIPKAVRIGRKLLFRVAELKRLVDGDAS